MPERLAAAYRAALGELGGHAQTLTPGPWPEDFGCVVLAAVAVSKGLPQIAEVVLELPGGAASEFLEWLESQ